LLLRALSAPLLTIAGITIWRIVLFLSGVLECIGQLLALVILALTARRGPPIASRPAYRGILPFLIGAFCAFGSAGIINLVNMLQAAAGIGLVMSAGDDLNTTLGLLGFLLPMALAMSARSLPMYAGLEAFPQRVMWPLAASYLLGLIFACIGIGTEQLSILWLTMLEGLGMVLMGVVLIVFVGVFLRLMRSRGRLPQKVVQLAPRPARVARSYQIRVLNERSSYGPFVALIASAYLWAVLGALLLIIDGGTLLFGAQLPIAFDAIRHSFAIGFIALLICGIAPRMLPGFSGGHIASSKLVTATLWLGNIAALLRVGSILAAPAFGALGDAGHTLISLAFGLSGPLGLALAICLAINLWPALIASPKTQ
ncbi:MAG TPA: hypothetical protein VFB12_05600, partial [Ktedonobacteraceae bacterium]|nr:hypothetical protein [Ktedonobacteraceae bacterium]